MATIAAGTVIAGKYRVVGRLGRGGMGVVFEAVQDPLGRSVAIKVLHGHLLEDAELSHRFLREARAAAAITSEHVVDVIDVGTLTTGEPFIVMEMLRGETLGARLKERGRLDPDKLLPLCAQLLDGLAAAHEAGVLHRDIKPDNVFLVPDDRQGPDDLVKIVDFGIAKLHAAPGATQLTETGALVGTPGYMSPEQALGDGPVDHRADLFAVGVLLYRGLAGTAPFEAETSARTLFKIAYEEPAPLTAHLADAPPTLVAIVHKALAKDPAKRFATARKFGSCVRAWLDGDDEAVEAACARFEDPGEVVRRVGPAAQGASGQAGPTGEAQDTLSASTRVTPVAGRRRTPGWHVYVGGVLGIALAVGGAFAVWRWTAVEEVEGSRGGGEAAAGEPTTEAELRMEATSAVGVIAPGAASAGASNPAEPAASASASSPAAPLPIKGPGGTVMPAVPGVGSSPNVNRPYRKDL